MDNKGRMDTFELFINGKLMVPKKEAGFAEIEWSKHYWDGSFLLKEIAVVFSILDFRA